MYRYAGDLILKLDRLVDDLWPIKTRVFRLAIVGESEYETCIE